MRTIVCTGDSHTWGQGAPGIWESFSPPPVGGELRLASFEYDCYVNLLRRRVSQKTGSWAMEIPARALPCPLDENGCGAIRREISLPVHAGLLRLEFRASGEPSKALVFLDGALQRELDLQRERTENAWQILTIFCPEGAHTLTVAAAQGVVYLYRVEAYAGSAAVINSGIGSCTTFRFMETYWADYVEALRPSVVLLEAHTINDWLTGDPPEVYYTRLRALVERFLAADCKVVMLTVSPVLGEQNRPFPYDAYVAESRRVARDCRIPLCDANAQMTHLMAGLTEEAARELLFCDKWHVNALGHQIYAEAAYDTFTKEDLL